MHSPVTHVPMLLLAGWAGLCCASPRAAAVDASPATGDTLPAIACPGQPKHFAAGLAASDYLRLGSAGSTDATVLFCNPLLSDKLDHLLFYVTLSDHFGIPRTDFSKPDTYAETSDGLRTTAPFSWEGSDLTLEDHHAKGLLTGPRTTAAGADLIGAQTVYLALHVGLAGGFTARWDREYLP